MNSDNAIKLPSLQELETYALKQWEVCIFYFFFIDNTSKMEVIVKEISFNMNLVCI